MSNIEIATQPEDEQMIPIKMSDLDKKKLNKKKLLAQLTEAKALKTVGHKILRVRNKVWASVGEDMGKLGMKNIGRGHFAAASSNADLAIAECDKWIETLMTSSPPADPEVILGVMQLRKDLIDTQIELGEAHIKSATSIGSGNGATTLNIPYPIGGSVAVAVTPPKPVQIEDEEEPT